MGKNKYSTFGYQSANRHVEGNSLCGRLESFDNPLGASDEGPNSPRIPQVDVRPVQPLLVVTYTPASSLFQPGSFTSKESREANFPI